MPAWAFHFLCLICFVNYPSKVMVCTHLKMYAMVVKIWFLTFLTLSNIAGIDAHSGIHVFVRTQKWTFLLLLGNLIYTWFHIAKMHFATIHLLFLFHSIDLFIAQLHIMWNSTHLCSISNFTQPVSLCPFSKITRIYANVIRFLSFYLCLLSIIAIFEDLSNSGSEIEVLHSYSTNATFSSWELATSQKQILCCQFLLRRP